MEQMILVKKMNWRQKIKSNVKHWVYEQNILNQVIQNKKN